MLCGSISRVIAWKIHKIASMRNSTCLSRRIIGSNVQIAGLVVVALILHFFFLSNRELWSMNESQIQLSKSAFWLLSIPSIRSTGKAQHFHAKQREFSQLSSARIGCRFPNIHQNEKINFRLQLDLLENSAKEKRAKHESGRNLGRVNARPQREFGETFGTDGLISRFRRTSNITKEKYFLFIYQKRESQLSFRFTTRLIVGSLLKYTRLTAAKLWMKVYFMRSCLWTPGHT